MEVLGHPYRMSSNVFHRTLTRQTDLKQTLISKKKYDILARRSFLGLHHCQIDVEGIYFRTFSTKSELIYLPKNDIYVENIAICHPNVISLIQN